MLILSVGCSGSGKSYFGKILQKEYNFKIVCPDTLRFDLYGSFNMDHDNEVWTEAYKEANHWILSDYNIYFDSTALSPRKILEPLLPSCRARNTKVFIFYFEDSELLDLCRERVLKDLDNKVFRSPVPLDVIAKQHERFLNASSIPYRIELAKQLSCDGINALIIYDSSPYTKFREVL